LPYAFIMAGGSGTRYWPRSRRKTPKHVVPFGRIGVLLERTVERLVPYFGRERVFVISSAEQEDVCRLHLSGLSGENLICEPVGMDSAPCAALAAALVERWEPGAVTAMFPADHLVYPQDGFLRTLDKAVRVAESRGRLVTIGVPPSRPAVEYGYIRRGAEMEPGVFEVAAFREKPPIEEARSYLESGDYYWNCGMFVWKASRILEETAAFLPATYERVTAIAARWGKEDFARTFAAEFPHTDRISIDYGVMEKTSAAAVVEAEFEWDDVGTWPALERHLPRDEEGNVVLGRVVTLDAKNCIICSEGERLVAVLGMEDAVVVDTLDALLVMPKSEASRVKELVDKMKREGLDAYL